MTNHNIEISWKQYETHGADEVEKIIKHELCHYHLHLQKKGYKHRDADFKQLLLQVGGTKHCKPIQANKRRPVRDYRYKLICTSCRQEYWRKNKVNLHRYACGKCRGTLQIVRLDAEIKK
ncbi:MAG: hypothetical protein A2189_04365 [Paenibacillus sp. RIFOXYA1_FULL_44_5]|nr:MAG: hypothetical protein A2189_04365 [Paenibacillus sp. RIFOXYA1_FULL_44_5]